MIATAFVAALITVSAVSVALIEKALGPDSNRFPCAHPLMRWTIRVYALALAYRAAAMVGSITHGEPIPITMDMIISAIAQCGTHGVLLVLLLRAGLPNGVWARFTARLARVQRLANSGPTGPALAVLAADGAIVAGPNEGPEVITGLKLVKSA